MSLTYLQAYTNFRPETRQLLRRLGWLATSPFPRFLLTVGLDGSQDMDPAPALAALKELEDCQMLSWQDDGSTFTIPPALQSLPLADLAPDEPPPQSLVEALRWMRHATPAAPDNVSNWPKWSLLAAHVASVTEHGVHHQITEPTCFLLNRLGLYESARANYGLAEQHYRTAISLLPESDETAPEKAGSLYNNLAQLLHATNHLKESEQLMLRALAIDEASFGKDHPNVATSLNNLAQLFKATDRLAEAEPLMRRALSIDEASFGKDHPIAAIRLNNLAQLLKATNRQAEAEPLMRRALGIFVRSLGLEHLNSQTVQWNYIELLLAQQVPEAEIGERVRAACGAV